MTRKHGTMRQILSPREVEIATLIAQGCSNKTIGSALNLTEHTVKNYICRMFDKIGCDNRVTFAVRYVREEERTPPTDAEISAAITGGEQ